MSRSITLGPHHRILVRVVNGAWADAMARMVAATGCTPVRLDSPASAEGCVAVLSTFPPPDPDWVLPLPVLWVVHDPADFALLPEPGGELPSDAVSWPVSVPWLRWRLRQLIGDAERRLEHERLSLALRAARMNAWQLDMETRQRTPGANEQAVFGQVFEDQDAFARSVHPDDLLPMQANEAGSEIENRDFDQCFRIRDPGGGWRWIRSFGRVLALGGRRLLLGLDTDITHEREAAERSAVQTRHLQLVLDAADLYTYEYDLATHRRVASTRDPPFYARTPRDVDEALHGVPPEDRARVREAVARICSGRSEHESVEYRIVDADGDERWLRSVARAVQRGPEGARHAIGVFWDITERKRVELELAHTTARLRRALEIGRMVCWDWDLVGNVRTSIGPVEEILGDDPGPGIDAMQARIHPDDRVRDEQRWNHALATRTTYLNEFRLLHRDGRSVRVLSRGEPAYDADGRPVRMSGVGMDISAHAELRSELLETNARLLRVLSAIHAIYWDLDLRTGRRVGIGPELELLGTRPQSREEFVALIHPADRPRTLAAIQQAVSENSIYESRFRVVRPDGTTRWVLSRGTVVRGSSGEPERVSGIVMDIDALMSERQAREAQALRHALALDAAGMSAWEYDLHRGTRLNGPGDPAFYGFEPRSLQDVINVVHPDDAGGLRAAIALAASSDQQCSAEFRVPASEGGWRWLRAVGMRECDASGMATRIYGVTHDISTSRRQAELQEELLDIARAGDEAKTRFVATMSHEVRTPLNGVLGMATLLAATPLDARQREMLSALRASGELLLQLVDDVLDFARLDAGAQPVERVAFDLAACLESAVTLFARDARSRGLALSLVLDARPDLRVVGNERRIRQILINLLGNAIKFTGQGGVRVRASFDRAGPGVARLRLEVADDGIGIEADALERIFEPFVQADASTTRRFGGSGLGLAITRRLCAALGGSVTARSEPGRGSTFTVEVPVVVTGRRGFVPSLQGARVQLISAASPMLLDPLAEQVVAWGLAVERLTPDTCMAGPTDVPPAVVVVDAALAETPWVLAAGTARAHVVTLADPGDADADAAALSWPVMPSRLFERIHGGIGPTRVDAPRVDDVAAPGTAGLRIVIAEDNDLNAQVLSLMLDSLGHGSTRVRDGAELLDTLAGAEYDVVLLDIEMPVMDGLEAAKRIRATRGTHPYLVATTAHVLDDARVRLGAAGIDDFVAKPVLIDGLAAALRRAAGGRA